MILIYILAGIVLLLLVLNFIAPKDFSMERSIVVNAGKEKVYNALKSLGTQEKWSVWGTKDPNMESKITGTDGEVGAVHFWSGNKEVGTGEQEITALQPHDYIETELRFLKPWKATNKAWFKIGDAEDGSKVSWGFSGVNKFPVNIMMMFMNMEKAIGKDFDEGLANFKNYIEA